MYLIQGVNGCWVQQGPSGSRQVQESSSSLVHAPSGSRVQGHERGEEGPTRIRRHLFEEGTGEAQRVSHCCVSVNDALISDRRAYL